MPSLPEFIDLLLVHGSALRRAGVIHLRLGDLEASLVPPPAEPSVDLEQMLGYRDEDEEGSGDPLDDPATYGLPRGAQLPGLRRPEDSE